MPDVAGAVAGAGRSQAGAERDEVAAEDQQRDGERAGDDGGAGPEPVSVEASSSAPASGEPRAGPEVAAWRSRPAPRPLSCTDPPSLWHRATLGQARPLQPQVLLTTTEMRRRLRRQPRSGRAEAGDEEAVAAVERAEAARAVGAPVGVAGGEGGGALLVLAGEQRAGGVDQQPAGLHPARRRRRGSRPAAAGSAASSAGVSRHLPSGLRRQAPVPEQGASASTRSQTGSERGALGVRQDADLGAGAAGALGQVGHAPRVDVPGHQPAAAAAARRPAPASCRRRRRSSRARSCRGGRRRSRRRPGSRRPAARPCPGCRRGWRRRGGGSRSTRSASRASGCALDLHAVAGEHHGGGVGVGLQRVHAEVDRGARACIAARTGSKSAPSEAASSSCRKSG